MCMKIALDAGRYKWRPYIFQMIYVHTKNYEDFHLSAFLAVEVKTLKKQCLKINTW